MMSQHTRLREKNGDLHLLVRFGHITRAANFFICTHLSRVNRKVIAKNIFHCSLWEPSHHGHPGGLILSNRRAFCMRMRQYRLLKCYRATTEAFSMNCLHSVPAFAGCFLELIDVYWVLRSTNMFFKVSRYFCDESEFIVLSLSPLRGQSFLS